MEKKGYNPYATPLNYETIVEISEIDPPLQRSQENFAREETDFSSSRKLRAPRGEISVSLSRGSPPPVMPRSKQLLPTKFAKVFSTGNSKSTSSREYLLIQTGCLLFSRRHLKPRSVKGSNEEKIEKKERKEKKNRRKILPIRAFVGRTLIAGSIKVKRTVLIRFPFSLSFQSLFLLLLLLFSLSLLFIVP